MDDDTLYRPWGTVTPAFWGSAAVAELTTGTGPAPLADTVQARLAAIAGTYTSGEPDRAAALAQELDGEVTSEFGAAHLRTAEVREVRGYLAHLTGDHHSAVSWYLHVVQLRAGLQGPQHPDTVGASRRAYSLWRNVPEADAVPLGIELLSTVTAVHGPDSAVAQHTRERLATLSQQATD
ncbi:hypothetical protein [Streptomyces violascens]|uniref:Tetratricopeptide repeat protein n=1 Tax=Streptomyces violascens TaxID=67381 RepID=A0ABQ3QL74_9ACTN|nr:hypothetical protein [Streptomyces violascens]GGU44676.1 hypothetical protein GCM10010289_76580 [Streptomyces violascens]GHI38029.1 hypothetical protein Sviol_24370 [Streptomyces violascens]